jgi:hypothetical protein
MAGEDCHGECNGEGAEAIQYPAVHYPDRETVILAGLPSQGL